MPARRVDPRTVLADYHPRMNEPLCHRMAEVLNLYLERAPGMFIDYRSLTKAAEGQRILPPEGSPLVDRIKNNITPTKKVCLEKYGKNVISRRGFGVRLAVDGQDGAANAYIQTTRRTAGAIRQQKAVGDAIPASEIRDPALKRYFLSTRRLLTPLYDEVSRLLPPDLGGGEQDGSSE